MPVVFLLFPDRSHSAHEAALEGARRAFGEEVIIREAGAVDEAIVAQGDMEGDLAILIQPELEELELALKNQNDFGSPRWPVIALSETMHSSGLIVIRPEDWNGPLLAQVFRAMLQNHKLALQNEQLKGDLLTFARRISHDLRANLSGILATAELLKDILSDHSVEDAELTTPLFDCTQAVLKLLERTSQVARATVESRPKEEVDMTQAVWAGRQAAEQAAVKLKVEITEPDEWPAVTGIQAWLEMIWSNLLQFAVQRSGENGKVTLLWSENEQEFEFTVQDQGPPMTAEQQAALLWPFEKLHQGHSTKQLLLPIARRLVELQGGQIGCESAQVSGLRFFFTLPKTSVPGVPVA